MKRLLCILLTAIFAFGLSACNDKSKETISKEEQAKVNKGKGAYNEYQKELKKAADNVKNL